MVHRQAGSSIVDPASVAYSRHVVGHCGIAYAQNAAKIVDPAPLAGGGRVATGIRANIRIVDEGDSSCVVEDSTAAALPAGASVGNVASDPRRIKVHGAAVIVYSASIPTRPVVNDLYQRQM